MEVTAAFEFSAAHRLPGYQGDCRHPHGHTYRLLVSVAGEMDEESGMLIDFLQVQRAVRETVLKRLDYGDLNAILDNPTTEALSRWIFRRLEDRLHGLTEVVVFEAPDCWVTCRAEDLAP